MTRLEAVKKKPGHGRAFCCSGRSRFAPDFPHARQEDRQQSEERQVGTDHIDIIDALGIGDEAKHRSGNTGHAEGKAKEDAGDHADPAGHQLLGKNHNRGKGRGEDEADEDREYACPQQVRIGHHQREWQNAEDREPDDGLGADLVADGTAQNRADSSSTEEQEQHHLRLLHRNAEFVDHIERIIAGDAGKVDVLGEDKQRQDEQRCDHLFAWQLQHLAGGGSVGICDAIALVPVTHLIEDDHADQSGSGEPGNALLATRQDDEGGEQGAERRAEIAADLKERLGQAMPSARGKTRHTRGLGMEDR